MKKKKQNTETPRYVATVAMRKLKIQGSGINVTYSWEEIEQILRDTGHLEKDDSIAGVTATHAGVTLEFADDEHKDK